MIDRAALEAKQGTAMLLRDTVAEDRISQRCQEATDGEREAMRVTDERTTVRPTCLVPSHCEPGFTVAGYPHHVSRYATMIGLPPSTLGRVETPPRSTYSHRESQLLLLTSRPCRQARHSHAIARWPGERECDRNRTIPRRDLWNPTAPTAAELCHP
jgi:hypothetical protein